MKKISYMLAALATIAIAAPAVAQDRPMREGVHHHMDHRMDMHRHHHHHHHSVLRHIMRREGL